MRLAGCQHEVVGMCLLEHHPHPTDVVLGVAPVPASVQIAKIKPILPSHLDRRHGTSYLARHKSLAADRAFVIEHDSVSTEDTVRVSVVGRNPIRIQLCGGIGAARLEWCLLVLWPHSRVAIKLRRR